MSSCRIGDVITSAAIMGSDIRYSIYQWEPSSKVKASASTSYIRSDICNNSSSVLQGASDRHDLSSCGPHALQVTMFANIVDVLQSVWLIHDPFYFPSVSVSGRVLHIIEWMITDWLCKKYK